MNVVIVGGGTPNKFGSDLANWYREQSHDVRVLSHQGEPSPQHRIADFRDTADVTRQFQDLVEDWDHIDLFLYNSNRGSVLNTPQTYSGRSKIDEKEWHSCFQIHVVIPFYLATHAIEKMTAGSKLLFMTTGLSIRPERDEWTHLAAYAGGKAAQNHLMLALAHHNNRGIIVTSLSPHFRYENPDLYQADFRKCCETIHNLGHDKNGKIIETWRQTQT